MCWERPTVTGSFDAGAVQLVFDSETCNGSSRLNAPLVRWPGVATLSIASAAVLITFAVVDVEYVLSTPGVNGPKDKGPASESASVAGVDPATVPVAVVEASASVTATGA